MPMRWLVATLATLVASGVGYAYWQIRDIDPEGGCQELEYWSLCLSAWEHSLQTGMSWHFRNLPTDQKMIDQFKAYREDFNEMAGEAARSNVYMTSLNRKWADKHEILMAVGIASYPKTSEEVVKNTSRASAYLFPVASTRYVKGATGNDLAMALRTKGYVFFRDVPEIAGERFLGARNSDGPQLLQGLKVSSRLDGPPWPSDWRAENCWLRPIETQWFLALCRDRVGG